MKKIQEKHAGEHRYLTHDNGGRPFLVYTGATTVTVYKSPNPTTERGISYEALKDSYTKLVKKFTGVEKKFIPRYPTIKVRNENFERTGNSILLKLRDRYVFIGDRIYSFKPKDEIRKYYSFVGNSDVPYPVAVGTENVYFMLDQKYVAKSEFPRGIDWEEEAYDAFYAMEDSDIVHEMKGVKEI